MKITRAPPRERETGNGEYSPHTDRRTQTRETNSSNSSVQKRVRRCAERYEEKAEGEETPPTVFYYAEIEWYSVAGIYGVGSLHIRGGRYNSNFNSAVSAVYDFQPGNVHSE